MNLSLYNDFKTFSKLVENVSTNKILGSLEILAIKKRGSKTEKYGDVIISSVKRIIACFEHIFNDKNTKYILLMKFWALPKRKFFLI